MVGKIEKYEAFSLPPPSSLTHLTQNENLSHRTLLLWSEDLLHGQFFTNHMYYTKQKRVRTTRNYQCEVFCYPCLLLRPTHVQQDWQTPRECHKISEQQTFCIWKCLCAHCTKLHKMNKQWRETFRPMSVHPHTNFISNTFMLTPSVPRFPFRWEGATIK